jgi:predicted lipoprotein with Yx(FWY)xxD motif
VAAGRRRASPLRLTVLLALAPALVAACGGSAPRGAEQRVNEPASTVRVERSKYGRILVDSRGRTLYLFTEDRRGHSRCYGNCERLWPPATVSGRPIAGAGLTAKLKVVRRRDHTRQLVYNGHPLYTLTADRRPGQVNGQGYTGSWFVISPAGRQIGHGKPSGY